MKDLIERLEMEGADYEKLANNARIIRLLKDLVGKYTSDAAYGAADELVKLKLVIAPRPGVISPWNTSSSGSGYRITKKGRALLKYWRDNRRAPSGDI